MWIFLSNSFLSVVAPTPGTPAAKKDQLIVRARAKGDINRVFPLAEEKQLPNRDYAFRAVVDRADVAAAMQAQVAAIDYTNFKNSVKEDDRHTAYNRVWSAMNEFQGRRGHGGMYNSRYDANGKMKRGKAGGAGQQPGFRWDNMADDGLDFDYDFREHQRMAGDDAGADEAGLTPVGHSLDSYLQFIDDREGPLDVEVFDTGEDPECPACGEPESRCDCYGGPNHRKAR